MTRRETIHALSGLAVSAVFPSVGRAMQKDFYENALVIDALCFGKEWGEDVYIALRRANYSGIVESLSPTANLHDAIDALVEWRNRVAEHPGALMFALEASDFERARESKRTAVLMNFQDSTIFEDDVDNVDALYALGLRSAQLTYNYRNLVGDGCLERTNAGLSEFGLELVDRMNTVGVMIDLSHCGRQTTLDGIEFSQKPVAMTHTMCESIRPNHPRAKTDDQIRKCAERGGVIGIAALGYFLGPDPGGDTTIETYADHIGHAVNIAGIEHVGLSTDFPPQGISPWATCENWYEPRLEWFKPSYEVRWPPWIPELDTPDRFRNLVRVLEGRGWPHGNLERLLGVNWLHLFEDTVG